MPKCKDCETMLKSVEEIKEKCPDNRWCTYICPQCGREIPIKSENEMQVVTISVKPPEWENICTECMEKHYE